MSARLIRTAVDKPEIVLSCIGPEDARNQIAGYLCQTCLAPFTRPVEGSLIATLDDLLGTDCGSDWKYDDSEVAA